jgi:AbrB family looped-hinge helix DNA binding protein
MARAVRRGPGVPASRLTQKYQATIPAEVRRALGLKQGDVIQFDVDGDRVSIRKQTRADRAYLEALEATLPEWSSTYDDEAYAEL